MPAGIEATSRAHWSDAIVWRGGRSSLFSQQGIRVLGAPNGRTEFGVAHLEGKTREHEDLFQRILAVKDTQACHNQGELLVSNGQTRRDDKFCTTSRWGLGMLERCSGNPSAPLSAKATANLPLSMGGLGLTSALEVRTAAFWASWADSMKMVKERHPTIANEMMVESDREEGPCFQSVRTCQQLLANAGFCRPAVARVGVGA